MFVDSYIHVPRLGTQDVFSDLNVLMCYKVKTYFFLGHRFSYFIRQDNFTFFPVDLSKKWFSMGHTLGISVVEETII